MNQLPRFRVCRSVLRRNPFTTCSSKPISPSLISKFLHTFNYYPPQIFSTPGNQFRKFSVVEPAAEVSGEPAEEEEEEVSFDEDVDYEIGDIADEVNEARDHIELCTLPPLDAVKIPVDSFKALEKKLGIENVFPWRLPLHLKKFKKDIEIARHSIAETVAFGKENGFEKGKVSFMSGLTAPLGCLMGHVSRKGCRLVRYCCNLAAPAPDWVTPPIASIYIKVVWGNPPEGFYKANSNGSVRPGPDGKPICRVGALIRNSKGTFLGGFHSDVNATTSSLAEAHGIKETILFATDPQNERVPLIIETNNQAVQRKAMGIKNSKKRMSYNKKASMSENIYEEVAKLVEKHNVHVCFNYREGNQIADRIAALPLKGMHVFRKVADIKDSKSRGKIEELLEFEADGKIHLRRVK